MREYNLVMRAKSRAAGRALQSRRMINQELAHLVAFAFHKPGKMPDLTKSRNEPSPEMSPAVAKERLRAAMLSLRARQNKKVA